MFSSSSYVRLGSNEDVPLQKLHSKGLPTARSLQVVSASPGNWTFVIRWLAFVTLETGFLLLGAYTLSHPIPLYLPSFLEAQAKGIFTVLIVGWQSLCVKLLITPIVQLIFSSEWRFQLRGTEPVVPGKTDKVSTLTSGFFDHIHHLWSSDASNTFRIAFALSLALLALGGISPGAIGVSTVPLLHERELRIANMSTIKYDWTGKEFAYRQFLHRSSMITHIEQLQGTTFKYSVQPNRIIPVPVGMDVAEGPITYSTDYWKFNMTCEWKAPKDRYFGKDGEAWYLYGDPSTGYKNIPWFSNGIFSLLPTTRNSTSAFLFAGRNSTFPSNSSDLMTPGGINLDNIPSTPTAQMFNITVPGYYPIASPLMSVLFCDPGLEFAVGEATLSTNGSLTISGNSTKPPVGNVPKEAANTITATALMYAPLYTASGVRLLLQGNLASWFLNDIMTTLFTPNLPYNQIHEENAPLIPPLSLDHINANMNTYLLSASKGFTDAYGAPSEHGGDGLVTMTLSFANMTTNGIIALSTPAIVASKLIYYITCFLVGVITILTPISYRGWKRGKAYPFSFESLQKARLLKE